MCFFFSSQANPEPGPGLPLRCSLAHKHKTAFIILPVAAQGLASKSYWFLSSLSLLHKERAFCKLLARFRPTKGTFIEPSPPHPHCSPSILPPFDFAQIWLQGLKKEGKKREEEIRKPHRWRVHSVLWMALYGLPLYMWQSKDASPASLKKELDKIIGLAAFLHDWHRELWERKACLLFLCFSFTLLVSKPNTFSLGRTTWSKQTKWGVWLPEKVCVCLHVCCHINNHLPWAYSGPHSKTTKSNIQQNKQAVELIETLWH